LKNIIIDNRMRQIEKSKLIELGYNLMELEENNVVYKEISAHVDIFALEMGDKLIVEKSTYDKLKNKFNNIEVICGNSYVGSKYPYDIKYNVCLVGKNAIHNFKYTDDKILEILKEESYNLIDVSQGYSNCSIAVIDDNSVIVTDKKQAEILSENNIDVLLLDYIPDIKLNNSSMKGFIGGAISRIDNNVIVFGDLNKIDKNNKIRDFIIKRNLNIIDFKNLNVNDYGGIIEI